MVQMRGVPVATVATETQERRAAAAQILALSDEDSPAGLPHGAIA
jgi:phosphoribosylcarboxyaminoimidazole (NCAIR) mutase